MVAVRFERLKLSRLHLCHPEPHLHDRCCRRRRHLCGWTLQSAIFSSGNLQYRRRGVNSSAQAEVAALSPFNAWPLEEIAHVSMHWEVGSNLE